MEAKRSHRGARRRRYPPNFYCDGTAMPELNLEFRIDLTKRLFELIGESGPLFHRWVPDGKKDALALSNADEQEQITVWFERRMAVERGFLRWKQDGAQLI